MKTYQRLALGILLGAICGAALAAGIIRALPEDRGLHSINAEPLVDFIMFVTNDVRTNSEHFIVGSGAIFGAVAGVLFARAIPHQKRWLAAFLALVVGIFIGGIAMYFPSAKWFEQLETLSEHNYKGERALAIVNSLSAIDRAATNQLYLVNFQQRGRETLSNYIQEVERWEPNSFAVSATNAAAYQICKKYLATH